MRKLNWGGLKDESEGCWVRKWKDCDGDLRRFGEIWQRLDKNQISTVFKMKEKKIKIRSLCVRILRWMDQKIDHVIFHIEINLKTFPNLGLFLKLISKIHFPLPPNHSIKYLEQLAIPHYWEAQKVPIMKSLWILITTDRFSCETIRTRAFFLKECDRSLNM